MKARIRRIIINPSAFMGIMREETAWRVTCGVPKKAELRGATLDPQTMNFVLFIEDESFDAIDIQNEVAPLLTLEIRKVQ